MPIATIEPLAKGAGGAISDVCAARLGDTRVAVAGRDGSGKLHLSVWDINASGAKRVGKASAGSVGAVAITAGTLGKAGRVVTAVRSAAARLEVIVWDVAVDGTITRRGEATGGAIESVAIAGSWTAPVTAARGSDGKLQLATWNVDAGGDPALRATASAGIVQAVAIGSAYAPGTGQRVVTPVRDASGDLEVIAWDVDWKTGAIARRGEISARKVSLVAVGDQAHAGAPAHRIVTAMRDAAGSVRLISWALRDDGSLAREGQAVGGKASDVALAMFCPDIHSYAMTAVRNAGGRLEVIGWRVGEDLERVGEAVGSPVSEVALVPWAQGVVVALRTDDGKLEVVPWVVRPRGVRLLSGSWGPIEKTAAPVVPEIAAQTPAARQSPALATRFEPGFGGPDYMVAAGHRFVLTASAWGFRIHDKAGTPLGDMIWANDFFRGFLEPLAPDGSPNANNINRYLALPRGATPCDAAAMPDLTAGKGVTPCVNEFYDVRVAYAPGSKRFVVISAARNKFWWNDDELPEDQWPWSRRYVALAVSKTDDPRDGFHQWMIAESNYADWPRLALANGMLVLGHASHSSSTDGEKPVAYVFDFAALRAGDADPPRFVYFPEHVGAQGVDGGNVVPVSHLDAGSKHAFLLQPDGQRFRIWGFRKPGKDWRAPPAWYDDVHLDAKVNMIRDIPYFRAGHLVCTTVLVHDGATPERMGARIIRVPVADEGQVFRADAQAVLDLRIGSASASFSYERPAVAVTRNGDVAVVFGRTPASGGDPPEVRYCVVYDGEGKARLSRRLRQADVPSDGAWIWPGLHHGGAAPDPDGETMWLTHAFTTLDDEGETTFRAVVGAVRIAPLP